MQKAEEEIQKRSDAKAKANTLTGLEDGRKILESLAKAIADAKVEWMTRWETTAIQLCVSIAEKIIRVELKQQPHLSQTMIRKLLEVASSEQSLIARVHPEDALLLEDSPDSPGQFSRFQQITEFRPDAGLCRGDCVVEFEQGQLDGRVSTQLQRLSEELVPHEEPPGSHE
jgi:flagellar biosynthesis/type III secretory pathway protein FliH